MDIGVPRAIDPATAILEEIHRSAGHVAWLEQKVRDLEESELVWSMVMEQHEEGEVPGRNGSASIDVWRREHKQEINAWWRLYERERLHLTKVSTSALRVGIEERRVRLAERVVDTLETVLARSLAELGINADSSHVRQIVGRNVRDVIEIMAPDGSAVGDAEAFVNGKDGAAMASRMSAGLTRPVRAQTTTFAAQSTTQNGVQQTNDMPPPVDF